MLSKQLLSEFEEKFSSMNIKVPIDTVTRFFKENDRSSDIQILEQKYTREGNSSRKYSLKPDLVFVDNDNNTGGTFKYLGKLNLKTRELKAVFGDYTLAGTEDECAFEWKLNINGNMYCVRDNSDWDIVKNIEWTITGKYKRDIIVLERYVITALNSK